MADDDARRAAEVEDAYAERDALRSASRQQHDLGVQRTNERDLAFNGLRDQRTFADPRQASPEALAGSFDTVARLSHTAPDRAFTDVEQAEWTSALGTQASHYAAEEGRTR